jgi:quercetin dioxygenase-like cupin family protein
MSARAARIMVVASLLLLTASTAPQERKLRLTPDEIAALSKGGPGTGTSGLVGITTTVLSGNPSRAGPYTMIIAVPAHTRIAAHSHRDDRSALVMSGLWNFGYGDPASAGATRALPPGSFYTEPASVAHFARTGEQAAVVYIWGFGPTDTHYVDPGNAPQH